MEEQRKNLKVSTETFEKLNRKKLDGETWDQFLSRCVEIDTIEDIEQYLAENMGRDRPNREEVIDVFISTRNHPSHAYWEVMASKDAHPAEFALLVYEAIDDALSGDGYPGQVGLASKSSPSFIEDAARETFVDFDGLDRTSREVSAEK